LQVRFETLASVAPEISGSPSVSADTKALILRSLKGLQRHSAIL
jgi:hypothetical protein